MTGKVMRARLAALIAAIALVFGFSFADPYMTNAAALAEENFLSVAEGDSAALPAGEETDPLAAEESADEEDADASLPAGEETTPPDAEDDPEPAGADEETAPRDPEDAGPAGGGETAPDSDAAEPGEEEESGLPADPSFGEEDEEPETWNEEDLVVMEDGDAGYISEEITEQFNNPDHEEPSPFIGTAEIRLMNEGMLHYGDWIVLKAEVRDVNLSHRLVWEASDGSGWFTVGYGETFSFILREESADCEYRVSIIAVD